MKPRIVQGPELLRDISYAEQRELFLKCLRSWVQRRQDKTARRIAAHEIVQALVPLLEERLGGERLLTQAFYLNEAFIKPDLAGFADFVFWLVGCGFAWPFLDQDGRGPGSFYLTDAGLSFLSESDDHPLVMGFMERLVKRCRGLPDDVIALLVDAKTCLDHALMRPAIQLVGVAYETAIEHVMESLITKGNLVPLTRDGAVHRINAIKGNIDTVLPASTPQERDDRFAAHAAYDFADQLRRRRNDASHTTPTYGFEDRPEAEEFFISAGRHLPNLWRMHRP